MLNDALASIHSETMQELLTQVLYDSAQTQSNAHPAQTSTFGRSNARTGGSELDVFPFKRGDVIEVQGHAGSGKTALLYALAVQCILPARCHSNSLRSSTGIIVLDCDGRWNVGTLLLFLQRRLVRLGHAASSEAAKTYLHQIHIFRPESLSSLASTVNNLPLYHKTHMQEEEIGMLILDALSTFWWQNQPSLSIPSLETRHTPIFDILAALQTLRSKTPTVIAFSNSGIFPSEFPPSSDQGFIRPPQFIKYRQQLGLPQFEDPHMANSYRSVPVLPLTHQVRLPTTPLKQAVEENNDDYDSVVGKMLLITIANYDGVLVDIAPN